MRRMMQEPISQSLPFLFFLLGLVNVCLSYFPFLINERHIFVLNFLSV